MNATLVLDVSPRLGVVLIEQRSGLGILDDEAGPLTSDVEQRLELGGYEAEDRNRAPTAVTRRQ